MPPASRSRRRTLSGVSCVSLRTRIIRGDPRLVWGHGPPFLTSSRPRLMIEERARSHRERVPHPRPEPVDGRNQRTKGRGEGGVASDMTDKARSTAKAPTLPDTQRRGGWGTRAGGVCDAVEDSCAARRNRWCHPEPRRSLPGEGSLREIPRPDRKRRASE